MKDRVLKLQPAYSPRARSSREVPSLRLSGVWLEQSGFRAGAQVQVTVRDGELTIRPV